MMERLGLAGPWSRVPPRVQRALFPLIVLVLLIFYPSYYSTLTSLIGTTSTAAQLVPTVGTMVIMTVYVVMALGLNVVVGYCGLLDLGYVAFYAAGAYIAGWFATEQFAPHSVHILSVAVPATLPGLHINVWALLVAGSLFAALFGIIIGLPTLRLRGDYLAIVTLGFGEIVPQAVNNGDSWFGHNVTNGPNGLTPIDALGFGNGLHGQFSFLPAAYYTVTNANSYYYWTGLALVLVTLAWFVLRVQRSARGTRVLAAASTPPSVAQVACAVADALHAAGVTAAGSGAVGLQVEPGGEYRCVLGGVGEQEAAAFAVAVDEVMGPLGAPRYVVPRWVVPPGPWPTRATLAAASGRAEATAETWHAVPTVLGANARRAGMFAAAWRHWVGGGGAVFTGSPEGAGVLAAQSGSDPFAVTTLMRRHWG